MILAPAVIDLPSQESMFPYTSHLSVDSRFSRQEFTPDGNLMKPVWQRAAWARFDHDWAGKRHDPQSETRAASCWTARQIYFAFECKYSALNIFADGHTAKEKSGLWDRDVVEVFVNPDPGRVKHYYEFEAAPNNLWIDLEIDLDRTPFHDPAWDSHFLHATLIAKSIWTCEMRIPVAPMTSPSYRLRPGVEWRGNFFRADGMGANSKRRLLAWSPTLRPKPNFHVPGRFGFIRFVK